MNTAIAQRQESAAIVQATESTTILQVIQRAAADPQCDIEKMERLMAMHERMQAKNAETQFNLALSAAQSEMRPVSADAENKQTRSRYATYAKLDSALRPIYTRHGFSLSFNSEAAKSEGEIRVVCYVSHAAGHTRPYMLDMPADGKGAKGGDVMTKTHAVGSGASYGMRYLLKMIFNVAVGEDDDDGNAAAAPKLITQVQLYRLQGVLSQCSQGTQSKFAEAWPDPACMTADRFDTEIVALEGAAAKYKDHLASQAKG
ncbi:ERF family protein [Pseudomonas sp. BAY1663]|uniref:ERF family protein n=1 Tax=Pseudomonas sp. BAY1663 TaxID=1439940 RepID=UPI00042DFFA1|nr:ERF family protein [Pseudomonas sp. BAY1663]EXF45220.1 ERF family protein [Pseudomonas sp. BAY1663]